MSEKTNLIEQDQRLTRQSAGPRAEGSGKFSEGHTQKGGVNAAPPCPRPNIIPVAQNKVSPAQSASNEKSK
jgi:hypothetical protein